MFKPEIETLREGQVILLQGHPAVARRVKIDPSSKTARRIMFDGHFLNHPKNVNLCGTGYDGGRYTLVSVHVPSEGELAQYEN